MNRARAARRPSGTVWTWADEVRARLYLWYRWSGGNYVHQSAGNPIAAMMRVAAGELPGHDISVPTGLTFEIEVTEKAAARMKRDPMRRVREAYRLLADVYIRGRYARDIERQHGWSRTKLRDELERAEAMCGRRMLEVENELAAKRSHYLRAVEQ